MDLPYTAEERRALERSLVGGRSECPRCAGPVEGHAVPPRSDVSYVRDRVTMTCTRCGATTVLDRRRIEPRRETNS